MKTKRLFITALASIPLLVAACDDSLVIEGDGTGGSGGSGTSSSTASTGTYMDVDAEPWSGNSAACPEQPPFPGTECTEEGGVCAWWYTDEHGVDGYSECRCWEESSTAKRFDCGLSSGGMQDCPHQIPSNGSDCFGHVLTACPFPVTTVCDCAEGADPTWSCNAADPLAAYPAPPSDPAPTTPITGLTAGQRNAWCTWYDATRLAPSGAPPLPETSIGADGYTAGHGCAMRGTFFANGTIPEVAVSYCEGNLSLSDCQAPISELSDCLLTIRSGVPFEHGCARYLEKPGCLGTIVAAPLPGGEGGAGAGDSCKLKVE
jgi:hypothetical protein